MVTKQTENSAEWTCVTPVWDKKKRVQNINTPTQEEAEEQQESERSVWDDQEMSRDPKCCCLSLGHIILSDRLFKLPSPAWAQALFI